jgi:GNAT superfamily N-acetyltransferase
MVADLRERAPHTGISPVSGLALPPMTLADAGAAYHHDLAVVRPMTAADAVWAGGLHANALPHGFFARLGQRFLTAYYQTFVDSPYAVARVAEGPQGPAGMVVGTVRNSAHYSWVLRRRGGVLVSRGLVALLRRPSAMSLFLRTRLGWYSRAMLRFARRGLVRPFTQPPPRSSAPTQPAVLAHIAVAEDARGTGAGAALVAVFVDAAKAAGCGEAVLVTLAGPAGAGRFYRRLGWTLRERHDDRDGRLLECYARRL